jgi:hypothetical protein
VGWCVSERIDDGKSQWRGAAGSRCRSRDGLQVQGGGAAWHCGGANSRLEKVGALTVAATKACSVARVESLLDQ